MTTNLDFGALEMVPTMEDRIGDITSLPIRNFATEAVDGMVAAFTEMQSDMADTLAIMEAERAAEKPAKLRIAFATTFNPDKKSVSVMMAWNERRVWKRERQLPDPAQPMLPGIDRQTQAKN